MRKPLNIFGIFLIIVFLFLLSQYLYYYPGKLNPFRPPLPPSERLAFEEISLPPTEIKLFSDVYEKKKGTALLDLAHSNSFELEEFSLPALRIISRGYLIDYLEKVEDLKTKLRFVDTLIIILPQDKFSAEETKLIKDFVGKAGKVLLIGDPTRPSQINSIATEFGLIFESDYLYNLRENDGNFRYIYLKNFKPDSEIVRGLERVSLYSAGSISPADLGIAFADENTFSSIAETKKKLSPLVLTSDSRVLAVSDLTFMIEPYNVSSDNNQFISNLANWLTKSERVFNLSDFPYFFEDEVQVAYADTAILDSGLKLKNLLEDLEKKPKLARYQKTISKDFVFLGLFDDGEKIKDFLEKGNISINKTKIKIEKVGELERKGTSVFYLDKDEITGRNVLIILSETKDNLGEAIDKLVTGQFRDWLVTDTLGIYQKEVKEEKEGLE